MEDNRKIRVAITQGDINGIGYEVILKTLSDPRITEICTPIVYGSNKIANFHRKSLELTQITFNVIESAADADADKINLINCNDEEIKVELGVSTESAGIASLKSLQIAVDDYEQGLYDVLVTAPINKHNIQSDDFHFPGHTEFLEKSLGRGKKSLMILMQDNFRVALVTGHIPVSQVPSAITTEGISSKRRILNQVLKQDFDIQRPRIAVLSLNPHAGDDGLLGAEEIEIITPAIAEMSEKGVLCFGPYAADGFFGSGNYKRFDAVLAMYHDQGLAPFKSIAMDAGINFTAGLPVIRTSPAHGTAYDIAGKNIASEDSFRQAIYTAIDIFRSRSNYYEMRNNPLRKQYFDKSGDNEKLDLTAE